MFGLVAVFIALGGTAAAISGGPLDTRDRLVACYEKKGKQKGDVRLLIQGKCRKRETQIRWSKQGPAGQPGASGEQGPPGPATGQAGGALTGSYPNPGIASGAVGPAQLSPAIPAARVTHDTFHEISPDGPAQPLDFNTPRYDTGGLHSPARPSRLTAPISGVYLISGSVEWDDQIAFNADAGASTRTVAFRRKSTNGALTRVIALERVDASNHEGSGEGAETTAQHITTQALLDAGDFVELLVAHSDDGSLVISSFNDSNLLETSPEFAMTWVAPGPAT